MLCQVEYTIRIKGPFTELSSVHNTFLRGSTIQSLDTFRNIEANLRGNGISSGQNIYPLQAYAKRDLPVSADGFSHDMKSQKRRKRNTFCRISCCLGTERSYNTLLGLQFAYVGLIL